MTEIQNLNEVETKLSPYFKLMTLIIAIQRNRSVSGDKEHEKLKTLYKLISEQAFDISDKVITYSLFDLIDILKLDSIQHIQTELGYLD